MLHGGFLFGDLPTPLFLLLGVGFFVGGVQVVPRPRTWGSWASLANTRGLPDLGCSYTLVPCVGIEPTHSAAPMCGAKRIIAGGRNQTGALPGVDSRVLTPHVLGIGGVSSYSLHY
ncbi:Hypothetical protein Cul210931_1885 [Corynebacterium ulcerans]|nr:Hypothetical protein Cul210931_1885 [Corynebacterium ulcerans]STC82225.1 Uncharacterised protein [Corynebacterium ulcerans]STD70912.1 Uncharacterised protein [Corynebacterium ulcerans]